MQKRNEKSQYRYQRIGLALILKQFSTKKNDAAKGMEEWGAYLENEREKGTQKITQGILPL